MRNCAGTAVLAGVALIAASAPSAQAVERVWTPTTGDSFLEAANWAPNGAPDGSDNAILNDPTTTAVLNFAGSRDLGSFQLGTSGETGGNVLFSGGTLNVAMDFDKSHIGDQASLDSTFTMTGSAVLNLDEPLSGGGFGLGSDGDGNDLEIGARLGAGGAKGSLIMRDDSVLRLSDDLKIGAEDNGNGSVVTSGNAQIFVGSGIAVSESGGSLGYLEVGGNSLVVSGNSAAAGDTANGYTNEGYLTLSSNGGNADVLIKDSGKAYVRTLQMRSLTTNMTVRDNGEFHVFDTFAFAEPNLGVATIRDTSGSAKASHVSQNNDGIFNLSLEDDAVFTIDSDMGPSADFAGLALSGGGNNGLATGSGGVTNIRVKDRANFTIQQDLTMTLATDLETSAESTLSVTGAEATVQINGNLLMSRHPFFGDDLDGKSTIEAVITGSEHTTIEVGGTADIVNGSLAVDLDGYAPVSGDGYTLVNANSIMGGAFSEVDSSRAAIDPGLQWDVQIDSTTVVLSVIGTATGVAGDYNGDNVVDAADYTLFRDAEGTMTVLANDTVGGEIGAEQYELWVRNYGRSFGGASAVPEPATWAGLATAAALVGASRRRRQ